MRFPWANTSLLALLIAQIVTGFLGLISGAVDRAWALWLHGIGAYAMAVILFWKAFVVLDSLERRHRTVPARTAFLALVALLIAALGTGFLWSFGGRRYLGTLSLITVHIILAVGVAVLLVYHVAVMRFILRVPDAVNRRAVLRLGVAAIAGLALWQIGAATMTALSLPGSRRRFTGSYETGSFTGNLPTVIWLSDRVSTVDADSYRLIVDGLVDRPFSLAYSELLGMVLERRSEIIDCTGGWYSEQEWTGIRLGRLLEMAGSMASAESVFVQSATGYWRRYPVQEAAGFLLATGVTGRILDASHGFPVRLVAPGRRGFEWVKWVTRIRVDSESPLAQPPLPLQ